MGECRKNNQKSVAGRDGMSPIATLLILSWRRHAVLGGKITIPLSTRSYQQGYLLWLRGVEPLPHDLRVIFPRLCLGKPPGGYLKHRLHPLRGGGASAPTSHASLSQNLKNAGHRSHHKQKEKPHLVRLYVLLFCFAVRQEAMSITRMEVH